MNIINGIKSYINEDNLKILITENKIDIINYVDIGHFNTEKVIVKIENGEIIIKGKNLSIKKLLNDEVLVIGILSTIEFR